MTVGEATRDFSVSKPAISRHLRVLEEAGAIVRVIDGRTHRLRLTEHSLDDAHEWIDDQRALWERSSMSSSSTSQSGAREAKGGQA